MAVDITTHPEYGPAYATYRAASQAARQSADDLALSRAESEWNAAQLRLMQSTVEMQLQQNARQAALERAKREFPRAPEVVYSGLTDPAAIEAAAREAHDAITAATPQAPATPPPAPTTGQQQWGGPPAVSGQAPAADDAAEARLRELAPRIHAGKNAERENDEFRRLLFEKHVLPPSNYGQR